MNILPPFSLHSWTASLEGSKCAGHRPPWSGSGRSLSFEMSVSYCEITGVASLNTVLTVTAVRTSTLTTLLYFGVNEDIWCKVHWSKLWLTTLSGIFVYCRLFDLTETPSLITILQWKFDIILQWNPLLMFLNLKFSHIYVQFQWQKLIFSVLNYIHVRF
jgi:hypothetical protein